MLSAMARDGARARYLPTGAAVIGLSAVVASVIYLATRRKPASRYMPVRDAGPENMENPPADWDRIDQAVDESFPCSDPPPHCIRHSRAQRPPPEPRPAGQRSLPDR